MGNDRRLFLKADTKHWQLFSFAQNEDDSSIFVGSPTFAEIDRLEIGHSASESEGPGVPEARPVAIPSRPNIGLVHIRDRDRTNDAGLVLSGDALNQTSIFGIRHLATVCISQPQVPSSELDGEPEHSVHAERLQPHTIVLWAVPSTRELLVKVSAGFNDATGEEGLTESCWGVVGLASHAVVWFSYQMKHMDAWPLHPRVCFHDGHSVPLFLDNPAGGCRLELRRPRYGLTDNLLSIHL